MFESNYFAESKISWCKLDIHVIMYTYKVGLVNVYKDVEE